MSPLLGISLKWQTEICQANKPNSFTDRQLKGPSTLWEHTHRFIEKDNGILMQDEVKYNLPLGLIGELAHNFVVKEKIKKIFTYREEALNMLFK